MNKKRFLKSILATSALAAALAPHAALGAAVRVSGAAAVNTSTAANFGGNAVNNDTDSVRIHANNVAVTVANGNSPTAIDLDGKTGVTITNAGGNVNIGSIGPGTGAASTATLTVAANTVTLTGTASIAQVPGPAVRLAADIYTGLGATTFADGATLKINQAAASDLTFTNTFDGAAAGKGELKLSKAGQTVTFNGVVGCTNALENITLDVQTISRFTKNVSATRTTLANDANTKMTIGGAAAAAAETAHTGNITLAGAGSLETENKAKIVGDISLAGNTSLFNVKANSTVTLVGNIVNSAAGLSTVGNGGTLTFDGAAARTAASDISGAAADQGTVVFAGKADVLSLGANAALAEVNTTAKGTNRLALTGALTTKKLTIGAAGIEAASDVTIGTDGSNGAGKLTFTDTAKTLIFNGDYDATGDIYLNKTGNAALTVTGQNAREVNAKLTTEHNNVDTLNFKNAAAGALTVKKDVGATGKVWNVVNFRGDGVAADVILDGAKIYGTTVDIASTNHDATLTFSGASGIVGKLKSSNKANSTIGLTGDGTAAVIDAVDNVAGTFANFNVLDGAKNAKLTVKATDADRDLTLTAVDFNQATADDSGLIVDLSALTQGKAYALTLGGSANNNGINGGGTRGTITFTGTTNTDVIGITIAGTQLGTDKIDHLSSLDATGHKVKLNGGAGMEFHTKDLKALEVELNAITLGMYNSDASAQVGKIVMDTAASTIAADSVLKDDVEIHFKTDQTLTFEDNVSIINGTLTSATAANSKGTLSLGANGGHTIKLASAGDSSKKIAKIEFKGAANKTSSVEVTGDMHVAALDMNGVGTLNFKGNLKGAVTRQAGAGAAGKLVLQGGSVTGNLGTTNAAAAVETLVVDGDFAAGDTAASNFAANNVEFNSKDATLTLGKLVTVDVLGAVTTDTTNTGNFAFNQDVTTGGHIGKGNAIKSVTVKENKTFTVKDTHELHVTNIKTDVNNKGTVSFAANSDATGTTIGSSALRFAAVNSAAGAVTVDGIYSTDTAIAGTVTAKTFDVTNAITGNGIAIVADGGSITKVGGAVAVQTAGSARLNGDIAGTLTMNGAAGKVVTSNAATITGAVTQGASTLKLNKTVTMSGGYTGTASSINFGGNQVKLAAAQAFAMTGNQNWVVDGSTNPVVADTVTLAAATDKISIKLDGLTATNFVLAKKTDGTAAIVTAAGANATDVNFEMTGNEFFKKDLAYNDTTGALAASYETDVNKVASKTMLANEHQKSFMTDLVGAISGSKISATDTINDWGRAYINLSAADKDKIVAQMADNNQATIAAASNVHALDMSRDVLQGREVAVFAADKVGVAAGDAADKFGLWAKGTFGTATQKLRKGESGYKSNAYGAYVGIDTMLNDRSSVGLMVGYANDKMKLTDAKSGGKTKANSWMFGAYGSYDFGNEFFAQANVALAQTAVKTKEPRLGLTATGKYDVGGYTAEVRGGYKFRFDNSAVTPTAGLRFNYLGDTSYTETGAGVNNKKVAGKSKTGIDAVAGVRLSTTLDVDGMVVNPEVHMNVDYALSNSAAKVDYNLDASSVKFNYKGAKPAKFAYNFGASVMTTNDNMEYGVGYDARISDKYLGHQSSVKVKLNF